MRDGVLTNSHPVLLLPWEWQEIRSHLLDHRGRGRMRVLGIPSGGLSPGHTLAAQSRANVLLILNSYVTEDGAIEGERIPHSHRKQVLLDPRKDCLRLASSSLTAQESLWG